MSFSEVIFRYLTFNIYYWINQHIPYHRIVQYIHYSWQMKEKLLQIKVSFYMVKIDKLSMLQHHLFWDWQISRGFPCHNNTYINQYLQTSLCCRRVVVSLVLVEALQWLPCIPPLGPFSKWGLGGISTCTSCSALLPREWPSHWLIPKSLIDLRTTPTCISHKTSEWVICMRRAHELFYMDSLSA